MKQSPFARIAKVARYLEKQVSIGLTSKQTGGNFAIPRAGAIHPISAACAAQPLASSLPPVATAFRAIEQQIKIVNALLRESTELKALTVAISAPGGAQAIDPTTQAALRELLLAYLGTADAVLTSPLGEFARNESVLEAAKREII